LISSEKGKPEEIPADLDLAPVSSKPPSLGAAVAIAVIFVLAMVALRWDSRTGFTSLISFGGPKWEHRLPELRALPLAKDPGTGYDGQFGAQLAVAPDPRTKEIANALDNPAYRGRRIFLAWTAHVIGGGDPWTVLQVYALQNVAVWLALSWVVLGELKGMPRQRAVMVWTCCMMTIGALDSVRQSLSDLSGVFLLALAVLALRKGRRWAAVVALAVAGLVRETSLLGATVLWPNGSPGKRPWLAALASCALAILPLLAWVAWLSWAVPQANALGKGNFDWPGVSLLRHCRICAGQLAGGNYDSRYLFGLVGALGLGFQSVDILLRPRYSELWWRIAVGFALLFWVLGDNVWKGYWSAARAVLPMTFAFNLLSSADRRFWTRMSLANAGLVAHGIWRMLP
jgi:hypothetical protein